MEENKLSIGFKLGLHKSKFISEIDFHGNIFIENKFIFELGKICIEQTGVNSCSYNHNGVTVVFHYCNKCMFDQDPNCERCLKRVEKLRLSIKRYSKRIGLEFEFPEVSFVKRQDNTISKYSIISATFKETSN